MRNKLIELLLACDENFGVLTNEQDANIIADFLLANGIIVSPCKVGDTVWFNTYKNSATVCVGIQPHTVDCIDVNMICDTSALLPTRLPYSEFGTAVFLTKEEAERHLEESR